MNKKEFLKEIEKLNIKLTTVQLEKLDKFYNLLVKWNKKINLTRIIEEEDVYLKHFYDSLTITKIVDLNEIDTLCDVGTGAGFPGIVLKIVYPNLKITLIDSLLKRVKYLNEVIKELELDGIEAIHTRAEDYKEKYDVVTARAVANIEKLLKYTMHLVDKKGMFIAMKGNIEEELSEEVINKINKEYKIEKIEKFKLPKENSTRSLVVIKNYI
ncbi:MAG: 16S rRNA (guanine(527)-N(7))-methyltransferase RsmG [Bacilli bacterium]|nr:16S rRNA (guanine(527)-N(7))-methyltransferase RsmG [Bacilli bacterium]